MHLMALMSILCLIFHFQSKSFHVHFLVFEFIAKWLAQKAPQLRLDAFVVSAIVLY